MRLLSGRSSAQEASETINDCGWGALTWEAIVIALLPLSFDGDESSPP
jgi:hypothetical protein